MKSTKKSISKLLSNRILVVTVSINIIVITIILNTVGNIIRELETEHLNEVVNNIENSVVATIERYIQLSEVISKNTSIINLMFESDKENPMHLNSNKDSVVKELQSISSSFEGIVINFGLLDMEQDGYLTQTGEHSENDFSFKGREYYSAIEKRETIVTSPYIDDLTGFMVVGIATPIIDFNDDVQGVILIDLSIEFLNNLILSTEYKETGSSVIFDDTNRILAHSNINSIGEHVSILNFQDNEDNVSIEFKNQTKELITYISDDIKKIGIMGEIERFDWKILTFMEYREFESYTYKILSVFILLQFIGTIITLLIASFTVNISLKPITYIREAMRELAKGRNDYKLEYQGNNEIGELADDVRFASKKISNYIDKIQTQLDYDNLTNLYTESKFIYEIKNIIRKNKDLDFYIISVDIDNFKYINDTYGYDVGSKFLNKVAEYYSNLIGENAIITRINGDNFLLFLNESNIEKFKININKYYDEICLKARKVIDDSYDLSMSCGIYKIDDINRSVSSMMDCSSYAKNKGKYMVGLSVIYYDENMKNERNSNNYVVSNMRDAVKNKEFLVYYQPKVDLKNNKIAGAEALVRWNNNGKIIPPNDFIPVFETNGFIETLDYYVIERTCEFIKNNSNKNIPLISINLSGVTLMKKNVVSRILSILDQYNIKTSQIELEVTESAFVNNFNSAIERINEFIELGFGISMDDFGCGESSLGRLKDIPIHVIKIDREFIIDTFKNNKADIILKNIVNMAKDLNLKTVVEGIETPEQRDLISELGCDLGQGYIFSRPVPSDEFLEMLTD